MKIILCIIIICIVIYAISFFRVRNNKEKWVSESFFFNNFTEVWDCTNKGAMRVPYRERLSDVLQSAADNINYSYNEPGEKLLDIIYEDDKVVFKQFPFKSASFSYKEFLEIINKYSSMYMEKFWCAKSEKDKYLTLINKAEENYKNK